MDIYSIVDQVAELLRDRRRLTYRSLALQFELAPEQLEVLKDELIEAKQVARDVDGRLMEWCGEDAPEAAAPAPRSPERRHLTLMFCDMVGSTALASRIDPEDLRELVRRYHATGAEIIDRYNGHIAQLLGDGILAYFGYPVAHEDDAMRAVLAALEIVEAAATQTGDHPLELRIGIHAGLVVVGEMGSGAHQEQLALGEAPNVAARVQAIAAPGEVLTTEAAHRLLRGRFDSEDRGEHALRGIDAPVRLHRILRRRSLRDASPESGPPALPLVGREEEMRALREAWARACAGTQRTVLLRGEAGIGKSRLVRQLERESDVAAARWLVAQASPLEESTPFGMVADLLRQIAALQPGAPGTLAPLEATVEAVGLPAEPAVQLLAPLLGLAPPSGAEPLLVSPEQRRKRLMETLVSIFGGTAAVAPLALVFEDLHWADPSTLELLDMLIRRDGSAGCLLLLTARPEFVAHWLDWPSVRELSLMRLGADDARSLINQLPADTRPPSAVVDALVERADGVPLFVEELARAAASGDGREPLGGDVPATLQDLLMARLDRLGEHKLVAQTASVLGREFPYALLAAVTGLPDYALRRSLEHFERDGLIYVRGALPEGSCIFKHALVQEAAYSSLLRSELRELHGRIGAILSESFPDLASARPEIVAHHYSQGGRHEEAAAAWRAAADHAHERFALSEEIEHLRRALASVEALPESPVRSLQEMPLHVSLGHAAQMKDGFGAELGQEHFARARALAEEIEDPGQLFMILFGSWAQRSSHSQLPAADEIAEQLLRVAERDGLPDRKRWAHYCWMVNRFVSGNLVEARKHLDQLWAIEDEGPPAIPSQDVRTSSLVHGTLVLWHLGLPDTARARSDLQLERASGLSPVDLVFARLAACQLYINLGEPEKVADHATRLLEAASEHDLTTFIAWARIFRGWAEARLGSVDAGAAELREALGDYLAAGTLAAHSLYLGLLADTYRIAGETELGLATVSDALTANPHERVNLPELTRIEGELLVQRAAEREAASQDGGDDRRQAEERFRAGIAIAREQGALMVALRGAIGLARLLVAAGRDAEVAPLLGPLYESFEEGFETRDLREARSLIEASS